MAIEQSKSTGNDMRPQSAKGAHAAGRSKTAGADDGASVGVGFAAVLAATDTSADAGLDDGASFAGSGDGTVAVAAALPDRQVATPVPTDDLANSESVTDLSAQGGAANGRFRHAVAGSDRETQSSAAGGVSPGSVTALLAGGWASLSPDASLPTPTVQTDVPVTDGALPSVAMGSGARGFMRTSQLQQSMAGAAGRNAGNTGRAGAAVAADTVAGTPGGSAAGESSPGATAADVRFMVRGRLGSGEPGLGVELGAKTMGPIPTMGMQAEHVARDWRGQEESRSVASASVESWSAESAEALDQGGLGLVGDEQPVQETVRYWVGADSKQQAELTVADVGGGTLDVTIHMQGKEAQVSFRADEQLARDALQASSGQLEQLLGKEGLTLSGLSVGTSSTGHDDKRDSRQGTGKTAKVTGGEATAATPGVNLTVAGKGYSGRGHALDLFV